MYIDHLGTTATFSIPITTDYGYVLIVATALALEILAIGFAVSQKTRHVVFS